MLWSYIILHKLEKINNWYDFNIHDNRLCSKWQSFHVQFRPQKMRRLSWIPLFRKINFDFLQILILFSSFGIILPSTSCTFSTEGSAATTTTLNIITATTAKYEIVDIWLRQIYKSEVVTLEVKQKLFELIGQCNILIRRKPMSNKQFNSIQLGNATKHSIYVFHLGWHLNIYWNVHDEN